MIPALVLTAGLGTRLRPLSLVRAKAAVPVAGVPLIRRILDHLAAGGVRDAVLNLHHLPHTITGIVGDGADAGMRVRYSWEVPLLGSAGGPRRALPLLAAPDFLVVNGDTLTDLDLRALVDAHRASGALVTLAVTPHHDPHKYGGALLDESGAVTGFVGRGRGPSHHFVGVQVVRAEAFDGIPEGAPLESVNVLYPRLIHSRPGSVRGWPTAAEFFDVGTPADYLRTSLEITARENAGLAPPSPARIETSAAVSESVVWDDVVVEPGARLHRCIVSDGVRVPAGTDWSHVTLRVARGDLHPGETIVGDLAVATIA